jgi:hypothetical protein
MTATISIDCWQRCRAHANLLSFGALDQAGRGPSVRSADGLCFK